MMRIYNLHNKAIIVIFLFLLAACNNKKFNDIDGNSYNYEQLGENLWMTENLNVTHFRNGDLIPEARTQEEWVKFGNEEEPAWCKFEYLLEEDSIWYSGKLYNWYAVNDPRGLAPAGWNIPDYDEWINLIEYLGSLKLTRPDDLSFSEWYESTNELLRTKGGFDSAYGLFFAIDVVTESGKKKIGFNGIERGFRWYDGAFSEKGQIGAWWCTTEINNDAITIVKGLLGANKTIGITNASKKNGHYVRCMKQAL